MTAALLDGNAFLAHIKDDLRTRCAALADRGVTIEMTEPATRWIAESEAAQIPVAEKRHW